MTSGTGGLVGRAAELRATSAAIDAVVGGTGGLLLIDGEAGIGKTSLLEVLGAEGEARGLTVLRASATALDRIRPFGPLFDALSTRPARPSAVALEQAVAEVEALRAAPPDDRLSPLQTAPEQRGSLVEAIVGAFEQMTQVGPCALIVDDAHVAESATVATLARIALVTTSAPLLVVVARRPEPVSPDLQGLVELGVGLGAEQVTLSPLGGDDLGELVQRLIGSRPGAELLELTGRTGGNPFLAGELLAALEATGDLVRVGAEVGLKDGSGAQVLTAAAQESILARFATLDDETTSVLRTASSLGATFTADELAVVLDRPVAAVVDPLERATRAGLVVPGETSWRFRHELFHEAIESTIAAPLRAPLQLDVARRLTAAGAAPERVVAHYLLGAQPGDSDAVAVLRTVASRIAGQSPAAASQLLERALDLLASTAEERDEVTVELIEMLMWSGELERAGVAVTQALTRSLPPELEAHVHESAARALVVLGRPVEAIDHALAAAATGVREAWATALASIFRLFALDLDGAQIDATRALELEAKAPDAWAAALGHLALGMVANSRGYFAEAIEACQRGVEIADGSPGREVHRLVPHVFQAMALVNASRTEQASAAVQEGRRLVDDLGTAWATPFYHYVEAQGHWTNGHLDDLLAECEAGLRCAHEQDTWLAAPYAYALSAAAALFQGRVDEAGRLLDLGEDLLGRTGMQYGLDWLVWIRGLQFEAAGDPEGATVALQAGWEAARGLRADAALSLIGPDLVRLLVSAGRTDDARAVVDALVAGEASGERFAIDVLVQRCTGLLTGDEAAIAAARATHQARGRDLEAVLDDEAGALVRLQRLGPDARAEVAAAMARAEAAGVGLVVERLRRVSVAAGLPAGRRSDRPTHGWDALTRSEWGIARLVGEGRSNPEIATELVVSRRTVESHLSRIYTKLEVANRTELALSLRDRELA